MSSSSSSSSYKRSQYPDYGSELEKLRSFITDFTDPSAETPALKFKYVAQLQAVANRESTSVRISLDDIAVFLGEEFARSVERNARRYQSLLYTVCDSLMPEPSAPLVHHDQFDVWLTHRQQQHANAIREQQLQQQLQPNDGAGAGDVDADGGAGAGAASSSSSSSSSSSTAGAVSTSDDPFPPELTRRYELHLLPFAHEKPSRMRDIRADCVGSLVTLRGIVTRVTDVAPLARVVCYICNECGSEAYQVVNDRSYTPLVECPAAKCRTNRIKGALQLNVRGSKFVRFQTLKLQEMHTEVPIGSIPRSLNLRLFGTLTRKCKPGDIITVTGIFLPEPYTGFRAIRAGLTADVYLEVTHVVPAKRSYAEMELSDELARGVTQVSSKPEVFERLAQSIAPEIYGHVDIKKALMLMMVAGVNKAVGDGVNIRGDINVLLMGDPGVAKSQLLKHIAHVAPRAVYTTGKGSSGVGLTAAVLRDPSTGDMALEGGSLVLADNGICCIDEFDKMEEGDRTAIHEVMEQQTVSIAKAGITTTLNARTAVLAAANPVLGRWNPRLSIEANLGLPTSLLSRFDLSFIILDTPDFDHDLSLARHITHVHMHSAHPQLAFQPLSPAFLRAYISRARTHTPFVPVALSDAIVAHYIALRNEDGSDVDAGGANDAAAGGNQRQRFCTARSLLSILRLAQAHARIHMRDQVSRADVDEAFRLMYTSKHSQLDDAGVSARGGRAASGSGDAAGGRSRASQRDVYGEIYQLINNYRASRRRNTVRHKDVLRMVIARGFTPAQFKACVDMYERLEVWTSSDEAIHFVANNEEYAANRGGADEDDEDEDEDGGEEEEDPAAEAAQVDEMVDAEEREMERLHGSERRRAVRRSRV